MTTLPITLKKVVPSHTPEPWYEDADGFIADQHDNHIGEIPNPANRRRAYAAVNACAGFATEALEDGCVQELRDTLRYVEERIQHGVSEGRDEPEYRPQIQAALAQYL